MIFWMYSLGMRECHHVVRGRRRGHIALHSHTRTPQLDRRPQCSAQTEAANQSGDSIGDPRDVTAPRWPARRRGSGSLCLPDHREVIIGRTHPSLSLSLSGTLINFLPLLVTPGRNRVRGENTILINGLDDSDGLWTQTSNCHESGGVRNETCSRVPANISLYLTS